MCDEEFIEIDCLLINNSEYLNTYQLQPVYKTNNVLIVNVGKYRKIDIRNQLVYEYNDDNFKYKIISMIHDSIDTNIRNELDILKLSVSVIKNNIEILIISFGVDLTGMNTSIISSCVEKINVKCNYYINFSMDGKIIKYKRYALCPDSHDDIINDMIESFKNKYVLNKMISQCGL